MKYSFDHSLFILRLLPSFKRKPKKLAWLTALATPLAILYASFLELQTRLNVEANLNSQVGVLEWLLNNRFDNVLRRIRIIDSVSFASPIRAYLQSENKPRLVAYLQSEGFAKMQTGEQIEYALDDFIVLIPGDLDGSQTPISRLVNKYKMGGKAFKIQIV